MKVVAATSSDEPAVQQLLTATGLLSDDWSPELTRSSFIVKDDAGIVGIGAIERCGNVGLLRSVAVADRVHGKGIGSGIVEALETRAHETSLSALPPYGPIRRTVNFADPFLRYRGHHD